MSKDAILLASGGMDSTVLSYYLTSKGIDFIPLFFNYGQQCLENEYKTLLNVLPKEVLNDIKIINISDVYTNSQSRLIKRTDLWNEEITADDLYLPYRNLLFLSLAVSYAQTINTKYVYSAFINSNHAKEIDCSIDFFNRLDAIFSDYGSVKIVVPFKEMSKLDVARLGVSLGAPIGKTYSCQVNPDNPCGACPNCVDRINAMNEL